MKSHRPAPLLNFVVRPQHLRRVRVMRNVRAIGLVLCLLLSGVGLGSNAQDSKAPTLEEDFKSLQGGVWWAKGFGISFHADSSEKRAGFMLGGPGDFTPASARIELEEKGKQRYIVFKEDKLRKLVGPSVAYRFEGNQLILIVEEGDFKGEHKMAKSKLVLSETLFFSSLIGRQ
jgi:hypothetical protein